MGRYFSLCDVYRSHLMSYLASSFFDSNTNKGKQKLEWITYSNENTTDCTKVCVHIQTYLSETNAIQMQNFYNPNHFLQEICDSTHTVFKTDLRSCIDLHSTLKTRMFLQTNKSFLVRSQILRNKGQQARILWEIKKPPSVQPTLQSKSNLLRYLLGISLRS